MLNDVKLEKFENDSQGNPDISFLFDDADAHIKGRVLEINPKYIAVFSRNAQEVSPKAEMLYEEIKTMRRLPIEHWEQLAEQEYQEKMAKWQEQMKRYGRGLLVAKTTLNLMVDLVPPLPKGALSESSTKEIIRTLTYVRETQLEEIEKFLVEPRKVEATTLRRSRIRGNIKLYRWYLSKSKKPNHEAIDDYGYWSRSLKRIYETATKQALTDIPGQTWESKTEEPNESSSEEEFYVQGTS